MPTIRLVEVEDVASVVKIERRAFASPWQTEIFLQLGCNRGCIRSAKDSLMIMRVLVQNEEIIGYVVWEERGKHAHLMNLAVDEQHRRKGWGTMILEESFRTMKQSGIEDLSLEVREDNVPATSLYESAGMVASGRLEGYYGDADAIIYYSRF